MALTNFPDGISSFGVPVYGSGAIPQTSGNVWFVNSTVGSNGNPGTADYPFATLAYALAYNQLGAGDVIVVEDGHAETVTAAAGILAATAGVQIFGLSSGTRQPTITFSTATTATFRVTGAGVSISGLRFVNGIASLATMLDIKAKGVTIKNNVFLEGASTTGLSFIDLAGVTANAADSLRIISNTFYNPTAGNYNHAIGLNTVQDGVEIGGNYIYGNFALSGIHNVTGNVATNVNIHDNVVRNLTAAKPAVNLVSACTGIAYFNTLEAGDANTNPIAGRGSVNWNGQNYGNGADLGLAPRVANKAAAVMVNSDTLFTITGGWIQIEALVSECVTSNDATASTLQYTTAPTVGSATTISAASSSLANAAAGASVTLVGTALSTAASLSAGGPNITTTSGGIVVPPGAIKIVVGVGSTTGTWKHYLRYRPLSPGVVVT